MIQRKQFDSINELLETLSPYISARAKARICDMSESQMLQYKGGFKKLVRDIVRINEKLHIFADELREFSPLSA